MYDVEIINYLPEGLALLSNDLNGWQQGVNNTLSNTITGPIYTNTSVALFLPVEVNSIEPNLVNAAEIFQATCEYGSLVYTDLDSNFDQNPNNDITLNDELLNYGNDEDDFDIETINVIQPFTCNLDLAIVNVSDVNCLIANDAFINYSISNGNFPVIVQLFFNGVLSEADTLFNNGNFVFNNLNPGIYKIDISDTENCFDSKTIALSDCNLTNCNSMIFMSNVIQNGIYQFDDIIYCAGIINANSNGTVRLYAGAKNDNSEFIELSQGFFADGSHTFEAVNIDCDSNDNY